MKIRGVLSLLFHLNPNANEISALWYNWRKKKHAGIDQRANTDFYISNELSNNQFKQKKQEK